MLETDLYTLLSTDASIQAAMGSAGPNNVWLGAVMKGAPDSPALVLQNIYSEYLSAAESVNALQLKRMQFDSYAVQYSVAIAVSNAVRDLIKNMRGVSLANTQIQGTIINKDMDLPEEPGSGGNVFRRMLEVDFWHTDGAGSVPFSPIQAPVAGSNAAYLEGVPVAITAPTDGQGLVFDAASGTWKPGTVSGGGTNFAEGEVPTGAINGTNGSDGNAVFTLLHSPLGTPILLKNGQGMTRGTAYTLTGNTITYLAPFIPVAGDSHSIWYRF